jgi:molecular chaperone IbpA
MSPGTPQSAPAPDYGKFIPAPLNNRFVKINSLGVEAEAARQGVPRAPSPIALGGCGMRTLDYAPLFRSTVGFDRLFDLVDSQTRPDWPPYNIEKVDENEYRISMAIAGFGLEEIQLVQEGNTLTVTGAKRTDRDARHEMLHRGLAFRNFRQTFNLAAHVKVESASLENGLLSVQLVREIPEQMKPRQIKVAPAQGAIPSQDNRTGLGSEPPARLAQAA